jgi:hypothetical protein
MKYIGSIYGLPLYHIAAVFWSETGGQYPVNTITNQIVDRFLPHPFVIMGWINATANDRKSVIEA